MEYVIDSSNPKEFRIYRHLIYGAVTPLVTSWTRRGRGSYLGALCAPRANLVSQLNVFRSLPVVVWVVELHDRTEYYLLVQQPTPKLLKPEEILAATERRQYEYLRI